MRSYVWCLTAFLLSVSGPLFADEPMVKARVSTTKDSYLEGEPIEIAVILSNPDRKEFKVVLDYPTFQTTSSRGIQFAAEAAKLTTRAVAVKDEPGGRMPVISVPAGDKWEMTVYLQRYVLQPKSGHYRLPYTLDLAYYDKLPNGKEAILSSRGELVFRVESTNSQKLKDILKQYDARLDSQEFWQRRAAVEALSVVEDPAVIPHLVRMLKSGLPEYGLEALARFPKDKDAQAAVVGALSSAHNLVVVQALGVLAEWKYELKIEDVRVLLSRDDDAQVRQATIRYIKALNRKDYLKLLEP